MSLIIIFLFLIIACFSAVGATLVTTNKGHIIALIGFYIGVFGVIVFLTNFLGLFNA